MIARKVCVVSGSRADYGILFPILCELNLSDEIVLQLIVTGSHLSPEFGLTVNEIEDDGFEITKRIESLMSSDTPIGVTKSMGIGLIEFGSVFADLKPDFVLLLGDRFELLAAATAALVSPIPIIHVHGGETTLGAYDEAIRHSITKMSHVHFTATEDYRRRVIQLGETPERVFNSGAPGLDNLRLLEKIPKVDLEKKLGLLLNGRTLLVTWHPVTLEPGSSIPQFEEILEALDLCPEFNLIFTKANADNEGRKINQMIEEFVAKNSRRAVVVASMGRRFYWSMLKSVDCVLGNSSSGIIEAPSAGVPTVNIGVRQEGRIRAKSVVDCQPEAAKIRDVISTVTANKFRLSIDSSANPYDQGGASKIIKRVITDVNPVTLIRKQFYDLQLPEI